MSNKDFKVKNKLQVGGITASGPVVADAYGNLDSTSSIATQFGGTGTTTSPTSGQILYSSAGTNYAPATLAGLPGTYAVGNTASRPGSPSLGQIYSNTQTGYIEVYTSAGWSQLGVIPLSATIGTATDVGTNIAYASGSVDVAFTPASGGGLASYFTAVSTPGSITGSASSSPVTVNGLTQGISYTFTVTATNGYGNALASSSSSSVTPTSLPQTPTIGTATATTGIAYGSTPTASLTFTAGATGGKTITNYKYSTDNITYTALSPEDATSPVTIPGLTAGTSYTFRLKAVNANGDSTATAASNSITAATVPQAPTIGTATVTNTTTVSLPFTAGATGGSTITSYTVTSSPSIALTYSGTTSPMTLTGSFVAGTSYTFTITAVNSSGSSVASSSSNSVLPYPAYSLSQTFNASGNYTVPAGASVMSLIVVGGGGGGGGAGGGPSGILYYNGSGPTGGGAGSSGRCVVLDYPVTPGTTYAVTVGAQGNSGAGGGAGSGGSSGNAGGQTVFGNLVTVNGGNGGGGGVAANADGGTRGNGGSANSNISSYAVNVSGATGGYGANGLAGSDGDGYGVGKQLFAMPSEGNTADSSTLALGGLLGTITASALGSGGGGGGGGGNYTNTVRNGGSGFSGGTNGGCLLFSIGK